MKSPSATLSPPRLRLRLRPIRLAEVGFLVFLAVAMGLPLLFLLSGSFNLAAPGKPAIRPV